jgi:hypothetical protein
MALQSLQDFTLSACGCLQVGTWLLDFAHMELQASEALHDEAEGEKAGQAHASAGMTGAHCVQLLHTHRYEADHAAPRAAARHSGAPL